MERKNKILVFIVFACIIIIFASVIDFPLNRKVIPSRFVIGDHMGFDLSPGKLNFGQIVPGYGASRNITIKNDYNKTVKINIKSSGAISNNLIVSENNFILNPFETKNITFTLYTDQSIKLGSYKGEIIIITSRTYWNV